MVANWNMAPVRIEDRSPVQIRALWCFKPSLHACYPLRLYSSCTVVNVWRSFTLTFLPAPGWHVVCAVRVRVWVCLCARLYMWNVLLATALWYCHSGCHKSEEKWPTFKGLLLVSLCQQVLAGFEQLVLLFLKLLIHCLHGVQLLLMEVLNLQKS